MNSPKTSMAAALAVALTMTISVASAGGQIDSCGTAITEPGNYSLSSDLLSCAGTGVLIVSSNVSLNMKGHTISCDRVDGRPDNALEILSVDNVSVTNGRVEQCDNGFFLILVSDSKITNMRVERNSIDPLTFGGGVGIFAFGMERTKINGNHLSQNVIGLVAAFGGQNEIVGNVSVGNTTDEDVPFYNPGVGIALSDSHQNKITGNTTSSNSETGIVLVQSASENTIRGNTANNNGHYGIGMFSREDQGRPLAFGNLIQGNTAFGNGSADLLEARFNPSEDPREDVQDKCVNEWIDNEFVSTLLPEDCLN